MDRLRLLDVEFVKALDAIEYSLYRGRDPVSQAPVLLRAHLQQDPGNTARLRRELDFADVLSPEWSLRPIALMRDSGRTMLLLEDPGGDLLNLTRLAPMNIARFLGVAARITGALAEIHASGLIHKDLKPDHVILDTADHVHITGFGFSSYLRTERQTPIAADALAGTLAYLAPERTGRTNQSPDTRSDLYSLGVIFYELLAGQLPFQAADALGWIHCHMARTPPPLIEHVPGIPHAIDQIVARLLAKLPEDRYQTAAGLLADLIRCLASWETHGRIEPFPLCTLDIPTQLLVPEKVYGRNKELHSLTGAVERLLEQGKPQFLFVSGHSGVGKSSLVRELHKDLTTRSVLFAGGKFDQFSRSQPYAAAANAFQSLVRQILATSSEEVARWRAALADALGGSGQLIANLVPELELLIGDQPAPPDLTAQDAQAHFQLVLARFVAAFATAQHPLILFFDDLQWLDVATLDFIERLGSGGGVAHLLVIGAYRDNEVDPLHPLTHVLAAIRASNVAMREIRLGALSRAEVGQMVSDILLSNPMANAKVSDLVYRKTGGNPFFVRQFLATLEERGLMLFDRSAAAWSCDMERADDMHFTDNVADMMLEKLRRLPAATQVALGRLACLGNTAEISTLELLQDGARADIHSLLRSAVKGGYVVRSEAGYAFMHDRIQEAAHELLGESARIETHLRVARLLSASTDMDRLEDRAFAIANHFNRAASLLVEREEREQVARLNLLAARRSKAASAPKAAIDYLDAAMALLHENGWERHYELAFTIAFERAECDYLLGNSAAVEARLHELAQRTRGAIHAATVAALRINLYTTLARMADAVSVGLEYLQSVGIHLSAHPDTTEVQVVYSSLVRQVAEESATRFADLPRMTDPQWSAIVDLLAAMASPALFTDRNLLQLVIARMTSISIERGNTHASALAYVWVGSIFGSVLQAYQTGEEFAQAGMRLLQIGGFDRFKARTVLVYAVLVAPWTHPLAECLRILDRSLQYSLEVGDLSYASYAHVHKVQRMLSGGDALLTVEQEALNSLAFVQRVRSGLITPLLIGVIHLISLLRGAPVPEAASAVVPDLPTLESDFNSNPQIAIAACWYWITKLAACVHMDDAAAALHAAGMARSLIWTSSSEFITSEHHFYGALARAAAWDDAQPATRAALRRAFDEDAAPLSRWAESCPQSFGGRAALVAAEQARLDGNDMLAMRLYDRAIARSQDGGCLQIEALANELAARFYDRRGFNTIAETYLSRCRRCYLAWGAHAKVLALERLYPHVFAQASNDAGLSSLQVSVSQLDSFAIVRASQALSSEILLPRLIETLLQHTIEHAGAQRGTLILLRNGAPHIAADGRASTTGIDVLLRSEPVSPADLPESGLWYAMRTHKRLIIENVATSDLLANDPYVRTHAPKSALYIPLMKQATLIGALYLESNLPGNVFTPDRITVLEFLASQAAISLENAYLYSDLGRSEAFLAEGQRLSHTGSWSWSIARGRLHWSAEHYRILALDSSPVPEPTWDLFFSRVHPEERETLRQRIRAHVADATSFAMDFRILLPDGSVKFLHATGHPKPSDSGGPGEYIGTTADITERKRAEDALRNAQTDLMRAARLASIGELTTSIAHEINQPLAAIIANGTTCINWLSQEIPKIPQARAAAKRAIESATRAGEIIQSVRSLARRDDPQMTALVLNDAIREIMVLLSSELRRRGVSVETDYAEGLRPILGNRVQLQQVVVNLIMNAIEAMDGVQDRERAIKVTTTPQEPGMAVTEISDTGMGMDGATLSRIFEPLYTTKNEGLGIGLSICRSIILAHEGSISARSIPGEGSSLTFSLPMISPGAA